MGRITMNYQAVVFDLDGTLLNTVEDIAFAMNTVLARHNLPLHSVADYHYFIGKGLANLVRVTVPEPQRTAELLELYLAEIMEEYAKSLDTKTKPYAGIAELLTGLTEKGIRLAILSNKTHCFMPEVVKTYFSQWSFELVFGARPGIPIKPNPYSALEIAELLQLQPQQIVYLGDTDIDMQTAIRAGMFAVGAEWGFRSKEELIQHGAQLVIAQPCSLLELF